MASRTAGRGYSGDLLRAAVPRRNSGFQHLRDTRGGPLLMDGEPRSPSRSCRAAPLPTAGQGGHPGPKATEAAGSRLRGWGEKQEQRPPWSVADSGVGRKKRSGGQDFPPFVRRVAARRPSRWSRSVSTGVPFESRHLRRRDYIHLPRANLGRRSIHGRRPKSLIARRGRSASPALLRRRPIWLVTIRART